MKFQELGLTRLIKSAEQQHQILSQQMVDKEASLQILAPIIWALVDDHNLITNQVIRASMGEELRVVFQELAAVLLAWESICQNLSN
jgi:hypothetical protein